MSGPLVELLRGDVFRDPWKIHEYSRLAEATVQHLGLPASLVDVGCGDGLFSACLRLALGRPSVIGIDLALDPRWPTRDAGVRFIVADVAHSPFAPGSIGTVVAKDLLHHVDDPVMAARTLVEVAHHRVVFIEANGENPVMDFYARENGDRHFHPTELLGILHDAAPGLRWSRSDVVAYPFYLPPTRDASAVWVWPLTGIMLLCFKLARSSNAVSVLSRILRRRRWPPPFLVLSCRLSEKDEGE